MIWCGEDGPSDQSVGEEREREREGVERADEVTARCTYMYMYMYIDELLTSEDLQTKFCLCKIRYNNIIYM